MPEEEEAGFTFVDKRRGHSEETASTPAAVAPVSPAPAPTVSAPEPDVDEVELVDEEFEPLGEDGLPSLSIRDRLLMCLDILQQGAWISMGLAPDPATGAVSQDIAGARVSIDAVDDLAKRIQPLVTPDVWTEIQGLMADLKLHFVRSQSSN